MPASEHKQIEMCNQLDSSKGINSQTTKTIRTGKEVRDRDLIKVLAVRNKTTSALE